MTLLAAAAERRPRLRRCLAVVPLRDPAQRFEDGGARAEEEGLEAVAQRHDPVGEVELLRARHQARLGHVAQVDADPVLRRLELARFGRAELLVEAGSEPRAVVFRRGERALQRFGGFDSIQIVHHGGTFLVPEGPVPNHDGAFLVPKAVEVLCFVNAPPLPVHPGNRKENENVPRGKRRGNGPSSPAVLRGEGRDPGHGGLLDSGPWRPFYPRSPGKCGAARQLQETARWDRTPE
jgi:hypothetical protein